MFGAMTFAPLVRPVLILLILAFAVACVFDLILSLGLLKKVEILCPERVHATAGRELEIPFEVRDPTGKCRRLLLGLGFGDDFSSEEALFEILLAGPRSVTKKTWVVQTLRRGRFPFEFAYLETGSKFGFWDMRRKRPLGLEVRV